MSINYRKFLRLKFANFCLKITKQMLMAFLKELEASAGILEESQNCLSSLLLSYLGHVPSSSLLLPGIYPRKIHTFHTRSKVKLLVNVLFQVERDEKTHLLTKYSWWLLNFIYLLLNLYATLHAVQSDSGQLKVCWDN